MKIDKTQYNILPDNQGRLVIIPDDHGEKSLAINYTRNLGAVTIGEIADRYTVSGVENTLIMYIPVKGCQYNCDFCSLKHRKNADFAVSEEEGGIESAYKVANQIDGLLEENSTANTLKLFNDGNILYGTERKTAAELNEIFWISFIEVLKKHAHVKVVEIEVRVDEFVGDREHHGKTTPKGLLRDRLLFLDEQLKTIGKRLRCILALEYVESAIIKEQAKFPSAFISEGKTEVHLKQAIDFMSQHDIHWLSYAMLGGRLKLRPLTSQEVVFSAAHTTLFALQHGARECIINSQYLDPIQQAEAQKDGVDYYIPTAQDMLKTLNLIVEGIAQVQKIEGKVPRVRLTTDAENTIEYTIGPNISKEFRQLILDFNNAQNQVTFFRNNIANMELKK